MKSYKQWSAAERTASLKKTNQAIKDGLIPQATKCERCGQTEGKVMYHNEDYSDPIKYLVSMCWRCHMILHSQYRAPMACDKYWLEIKAGKMYPPVFKHDFKILEVDHGIK